MLVGGNFFSIVQAPEFLALNECLMIVVTKTRQTLKQHQSFDNDRYRMCALHLAAISIASITMCKVVLTCIHQ